MKKYLLILILSIILISSLYNFFYIEKVLPILRDEAHAMILADYYKLYDIKRAEADTVNFDYISTNYFTVSQVNLIKLVSEIARKDSSGFLVYRFSLDSKYSNFGFWIDGVDKNNIQIPNLPIIKISPFSKNPIPKNYTKIFKKLNKKKIFGFNHNFQDGVKYPIVETMKWLNLHKSDEYYLYPATDTQPSSSNFTSIIISNDKKLRTNFLSQTKDLNFYGDKGQGCCPQ